MARGKGVWHADREKLPAWKVLRARNQGLSNAEIAAKYGVSRALVTQKCREMGIALPPRVYEPRLCLVCQSAFTPKADTQTCCCDDHRDRYYRERKRETNEFE